MPGYSCRPHSPSETCWLKLFALPISLAWSYLAQVSRACCYCVLLCPTVPRALRPAQTVLLTAAATSQLLGCFPRPPQLLS